MTKYEPDENLLWVNHKKAAIEPRRRNLGKEITESLPTIDVDGTAMDIFSACAIVVPIIVPIALKYGIDMLWLGARTVVNPFSVQAISDALKGVDIPVMVKNPINPDLKLWIGAIERVYRAGIKKIAAIHRGFSPFEKTL